jgi:hypothetical protein
LDLDDDDMDDRGQRKANGKGNGRLQSMLAAGKEEAAVAAAEDVPVYGDAVKVTDGAAKLKIYFNSIDIGCVESFKFREPQDNLSNISGSRTHSPAIDVSTTF